VWNRNQNPLEIKIKKLGFRARRRKRRICDVFMYHYQHQATVVVVDESVRIFSDFVAEEAKLFLTRRGSVHARPPGLWPTTAGFIPKLACQGNRF